ncbi:MAG TPA: metallophosphoesterase family protein [Thermoanaerobaculia bacterium]|nr:metallophosphoesterase family protein [Thermoanaerobaculia bacterium]
MRSLLHISDIHFGPKHLEDRAAAVLALIHQRAPDYVVISGDLTQRAKPEQFAAARQFVESIPCPTLAVPGNHDVPLYRFWERLVAPFGAWRRHFSPELEPHLVDDAVCIVGVNSAFNRTLTGGRITRAQCRRVRDVFSAAPPSCYRIAVIHHNLVRPADLDDVPAPLQGSVPAVAALASSGVEMVLSGHLHQSYVAPLAVAGGDHGGIILCAGTTTSSRGRGDEAGLSTCHWIEIHADQAQVLFNRWDPGASSFVETLRRSFPRRAASSRPAAAIGGGHGA